MEWIKVAGGCVLIIGSAILSLLRVRREPYLAIGLLWFTGTLIPVIGLIQVGSQAMADRYTYLPSIGLAIVVVWGIRALAERFRAPKWILAAGVGTTVLLLSLLSRSQLSHWRSSEALFRDALEVTSENWIAHANLGSALAAAGQADEAVNEFRKALRIAPGSSETHYNLGVALMEQGRVVDALPHFEEAIRLSPQYVEAHNNLGILLHQQGRIEEAIGHYRTAVEARPFHAQARLNLGMALAETGRDTEAEIHLREALKYRPQDPIALYYLQVVQARRGVPAGPR